VIGFLFQVISVTVQQFQCHLLRAVW